MGNKDDEVQRADEAVTLKRHRSHLRVIHEIADEKQRRGAERRDHDAAMLLDAPCFDQRERDEEQNAGERVEARVHCRQIVDRYHRAIPHPVTSHPVENHRDPQQRQIGDRPEEQHARGRLIPRPGESTRKHEQGEPQHERRGEVRLSSDAGASWRLNSIVPSASPDSDTADIV